MRNYKEALFRLHFRHDYKTGLEECDDVKTLQELVDRATPMKPIYAQQHKNSYDSSSITVYINVPTCPICSTVLYEGECCRNNECRQAMDWDK